ncbi:nitroreductase family protein [Streptomyces sp. NPDC050658]|uniref:nitroreductase family protein n=1 Tax=unclassified Streptomyces TaxID=2593676 RepID=UPI00344A0AF7
MDRSRTSQVVLDYVHAVRGRWTQPVAPPGFAPDWADRPAPHTHYPHAVRRPLPPHTAGASASGGGCDLPLVGSLLQLTAGVLSRRWQIDWSPDVAGQDTLTGARWGRGTPSGGGANPLELYLAAGPGAPVPPGIHHYATGLHALEQVADGDPGPAVREALGEEPGSPRVGHLLCALRFWKTAYKYNNFAYHLMLHDLGAFLGSWDTLCAAHGIASRPRLAFDDAALSRLVGQVAPDGGVFAVLPLPWAESDGGTVECRGTSVAPVPYERSRRTRRFPLVTAVHEATSGIRDFDESGLAEPPAAARPADAITLPAPTGRPGTAAVVDALARRASANGRIDGSRPVDLPVLGELLAATAPGADAALHGAARLRLAAHRVTGLAPGVYDYLPEHHALAPVVGASAALDGRVYTLPNYSVGQAAVTLVPHWRPERAVDRAGPRAYRYAAVAAGAGAQRLHLAATRSGLASGIVLGFDGPLLESALGLDASGSHALLCVFLGHRQAGAARLDDRLC